MTIKTFMRTVVGACVLVAVCLFLLNGSLLSYKLLGHNLGISQRDFRVYDNFQDSQSNDNTTPDPDFGGLDGAILALWKGCIEWGSEEMGNSTWGNGGANFDPVYVGEATSNGGNTGNVIAPLNQNGGNVLAFMSGGGNGWRIRFYDQPWVWHDGPGSTPSGGNNIDLQGVGCHEYGHAIGMDHSQNSSATMWWAVSGAGNGQRTINSDDISGVQAIYGSMSASKPHISSLSGSFDIGGTLIIDGNNFTTTGNEVWFTGDGSVGEAVKVTGVSSTSGGTHIEVVIPAGTNSGTVVVKKSGSGHSTLSNNYPLEVGGLSGNPPVPDIKIDGSDGPLSVPQTQAVNITLSLDPGDQGGIAFDWWIFAEVNWTNHYYWSPSGSWKLSAVPIRSYNGPLFSTSDYTITNGTLPAGWYIFTFALDSLNNSYEGTFIDTVEIQSF